MRILVSVALALQILSPELELERRRLLQDHTRPRTGMFVVIARYGDGTPARGTISCEGLWCKYGGGDPKPEEEEIDYCGPYLPFETDSRGACIFNPPLDWIYDEMDDSDSWLTCYATAGTRSGKLTFKLQQGGIHVITIPGGV